MKLRADQLKKHLTSHGLLPIVILSGDTPLLLQEATDLVRQAAKQAGYEERQRFDVGSTFKWEQLQAAAQALSLFSERTMIELHLPSAKPGKIGAKVLAEYAKQCPEDKFLLIVTAKLDSATQRAAWLKALEAQGLLVQIWPVPAQQLPRWLSERLQQAGLSMDPPTLARFAELVEGNLLAAKQLIDKLLLLQGAGSVSQETLLEALSDQAQFDGFQVIDYALQGKQAPLCRAIEQFRAQDQHPSMMLWAVARELRRLIAIKKGVEQGEPLARLYQSQGIWDKQKPAFKRVLDRHSQKSLLQLLQQTSRIDRMSKGAIPGDAWDLMLDLLVRI